MGKFVTRTAPTPEPLSTQEEQNSSPAGQILGVFLILVCILGAIATLMLTLQ